MEVLHKAGRTIPVEVEGEKNKSTTILLSNSLDC